MRRVKNSQPLPVGAEFAELQEQLLSVHRRADCNAVISWINLDGDRFCMLLSLLTGSDRKLAAKAAWPFPEAANLNAAIAEDALPDLLNLLNQPRVHHAVKRAILKWLTTASIPEAHHGRLMHQCFETAASTTEKPAAKAYALHVLGKLAIRYPEIRPELQVLIEEKSPMETAAFRAVGRKLGKP